MRLDSIAVHEPVLAMIVPGAGTPGGVHGDGRIKATGGGGGGTTGVTLAACSATAVEKAAGAICVGIGGAGSGRNRLACEYLSCDPNAEPGAPPPSCQTVAGITAPASLGTSLVGVERQPSAAAAELGDAGGQ